MYQLNLLNRTKYTGLGYSKGFLFYSTPDCLYLYDNDENTKITVVFDSNQEDMRLCNYVSITLLWYFVPYKKLHMDDKVIPPSKSEISQARSYFEWTLKHGAYLVELIRRNNPLDITGHKYFMIVNSKGVAFTKVENIKTYLEFGNDVIEEEILSEKKRKGRNRVFDFNIKDNSIANVMRVAPKNNPPDEEIPSESDKS